MANVNWLKILMIISVVTILAPPISGATNKRKLDETTEPLIPGTSIKCGCSSCDPCIQTPSPPPPSPPLYPPPPVVLPPPPPVVLPPPPPKKTPTPGINCPPPPQSPIIYPPYIFIGPPGNLYPIDNYSGAFERLEGGLMTVIMCGLVGVVLAFW